MAQSDARFGYRAKLNRDSHDLSMKFGFTCAPGMLLPIFADLATPSDSYYIEHDLTYLRTAPLLAPAQIDVKVHYETFFIPMQMMYQPIEQTLWSMLQPQSSMYNINGNWRNNGLPLFAYNAVKESVCETSAQLKTSALRSDCFRMADMLGLNGDNFAYDANNPSRWAYAPSFFPWQLLAYNTIYQYYYRLDDKSQFNNQRCNWDNLYQVDEVGQSNGSPTMFQIWQRPWRFDYFTSMYRSPIVSNANLQNVLPQTFYQDFIRDGNGVGTTLPINTGGGALNSNEDMRAFASDVTNNAVVAAELRGSVNTAMIRQMFANEKLAMITGRARKSYDAQVLAHFGVDVPHDVKHDITLIGHDTYHLNIGEVTSLASTNDAGLGDLAGKGWSQGRGKKIKFTAPCHGVIMTIFSVEPEKRYFGGFDRQNAIQDSFDIPQPEFDRLGNVPMYRYETGELAGSGVVTNIDIIGWKERYYWNKRKHDKVSLAFMAPASFRGYNSYAAYMLASAPFGAYTSSNNNTARPDLESRFYIDRNCMDGLMLTPYVSEWQVGAEGQATEENWNATPWLAYARDPFIVDSFEKVTKVSWLSKDGEPIYNV